METLVGYFNALLVLPVTFTVFKNIFICSSGGVDKFGCHLTPRISLILTHSFCVLPTNGTKLKWTLDVYLQTQHHIKLIMKKLTKEKHHKDLTKYGKLDYIIWLRKLNIQQGSVQQGVKQNEIIIRKDRGHWSTIKLFNSSFKSVPMSSTIRSF